MVQEGFLNLIPQKTLGKSVEKKEIEYLKKI